MTVEMVPTLINGRWPLTLPPHRAEFYADNRLWEHERLSSMADLLEPGMTCLYVGAEEGDHPGLVASWGCRVAMVECKAEAWRNIRAVWELNDLDPPAGMFVGFASDETDLRPLRPYDLASGYAREQDGWPLCSHGAPQAVGFAHLSEQADSIPQVTLDDFARDEILTVDAISVDTEGSELRVLHGADRILTEDRPLCWISCHLDRDWMRDQYHGVGKADVDEFMDGYGYDGVTLAESHETHVLYSPRA